MIRLSLKTKSAIIRLFKKYFPTGKLYLFGSRVDPNKRGGDIDLLCEQDGDVHTLMNQQFSFLRDLYKVIDEQKIDFILYRPSDTPHLKIAKIAKEKGVRIDMNDDIESVMVTAERHNNRLTWAMSQMKSFMPLTPLQFEKLTDAQLAALEMFASRFGKLQNVLGVKLLPLILEVTQEPGDYPTFVDKLNRLEKMGVIPSADDWSTFREIRNKFTHDYPEDSQLNSDLLNKAYEEAKKLQTTFTDIKNYITKNNLK